MNDDESRRQMVEEAVLHVRASCRHRTPDEAEDDLRTHVRLIEAFRALDRLQAARRSVRVDPTSL